MKTFSLVTLFAMSFFSGFVAASEGGPRCFEPPEGYGEAIMIDRSEDVENSNKIMTEASSDKNHFQQCLAVVLGGVSKDTIQNVCGCLDAAKEVCDLDDPSSDCLKILD